MSIFIMHLNILGLDIDYKDVITTSTGGTYRLVDDKLDLGIKHVELAKSLIAENRVIILGFLNLRSEIVRGNEELNNPLKKNGWDRFINVLRKEVAKSKESLLIFAAPNYPLTRICCECNSLMSKNSYYFDDEIFNCELISDCGNSTEMSLNIAKNLEHMASVLIKYRPKLLEYTEVIAPNFEDMLIYNEISQTKLKPKTRSLEYCLKDIEIYKRKLDRARNDSVDEEKIKKLKNKLRELIDEMTLKLEIDL